MITPSGSVMYSGNKLNDEKNYRRLMQNIERYTQKGFSKEEMNEALAGNIEEYYNNGLRKFYSKNIHKEEIYKVIDREIVDFTVEAMQSAAKQLNREVSQKDILVVSFHLKYLLERKGAGKGHFPNRDSPH